MEIRKKLSLEANRAPATLDERKVDIAREVLKMKNNGYSEIQISSMLGLAPKVTHRLLRDALNEHGVDIYDHDMNRKLHNAQYEALLNAVLPDAISGDIGAHKAALTTMKQREAILSMTDPAVVKHLLSGGTGAIEHVGGDSERGGNNTTNNIQINNLGEVHMNAAALLEQFLNPTNDVSKKVPNTHTPRFDIASLKPSDEDIIDAELVDEVE